MSSDLAAIAETHGVLHFVAWPCDDAIFDADSHEAIEILAAVLGPTCVIALHYLARRLRPPAISTTCDLGELSQTCGGGTNVATRDARIIRALLRLEHFGYLRHDGTGRCEIRTQIPPLHPGRAARLPAELHHLLGQHQPLH